MSSLHDLHRLWMNRRWHAPFRSGCAHAHPTTHSNPRVAGRTSATVLSPGPLSLPAPWLRKISGKMEDFEREYADELEMMTEESGES